VCLDFLWKISLKLFSQTFLIIRRTEQFMTKICIVLHENYQFFFADFNEIWIFWKDFSKNIQISSFMKMCSVAAKLSHTTTRTGTHNEANSRFSQFCEAPNESFSHTTVQQRQHTNVVLCRTFYFECWFACLSLIFCEVLVGTAGFVLGALNPFAPYWLEACL